MESFTIYLLTFAFVAAVADAVVKESRSDKLMVGFKRLGNYYIPDANHNSPKEKIYFLSVTFRANWMASQSFCNSLGMDLMALENPHEADYFLKNGEKSLGDFKGLLHIGGVSNANQINDHESWFWIATQKQVSIDLKLKQSKSGVKSDQNCLQLVKQKSGFSYTRTNCFSNELRQFVCQKIIDRKLDIWSTIVGR